MKPIKQPAAGSRWELWWKLSTNGFVLMLAGAALSTLVIPRLTAVAARQRLLQEQRLAMQREIIRNGGLTDRQLNGILTRMEIFHKNNRRLKPARRELRAAQERLEEDVNRMYLALDDNAWWWHQSLYQEAVILNLSPAGPLDSLKRDMSRYQQNVIASVEVLNRMWDRCLSAEYDYDGRCARAMECDSVRAQMGELRDQRASLVGRLVGYFR